MESSENLGLGDTGFSHHEDDELGVDLASFLACRMREGGCRGQGCVLPSEYWKVVLYEWYGSAAHEGAVTASFLKVTSIGEGMYCLCSDWQTSLANALSTMF